MSEHGDSSAEAVVIQVGASNRRVNTIALLLAAVFAMGLFTSDVRSCESRNEVASAINDKVEAKADDPLLVPVEKCGINRWLP